MEASTPEVSHELALVPLADVIERLRSGSLRVAEEVLRRRAVNEESVEGFLRGLPPPLLTVWEHGAPAVTLHTAWWSGAWTAREDAWWLLDGAEWVAALLRVASRAPPLVDDGRLIPVCVVRGGHGSLRAALEHLRRLKRAPVTAITQLPFRGRTAGGTIADLVASLSQQGFGELDVPLVARCVTAIVDGDQGGPLQKQVDRPMDTKLYDRSASALQRALVFLQGRARVPNVAVLPYGLYLVVLARFFHKHPSPHARNQMLLTRWYWRDVLAAHEDRGAAMAIRRMQGCVTDDEHASVQALLQQGRAPRPTAEQCWGRVRANPKLLASALAALAPRDATSGDQIPLAGHFNRPRKHWFVRIVVPGAADGPSGSTLFLHRPSTAQAFARALVEASSEVLTSHDVPEPARDALRSGDIAGFVALREAALQERVTRFTEFLASWGAPDRPPIAAFRVAETPGRPT